MRKSLHIYPFILNFVGSNEYISIKSQYETKKR